MKWLTHQTGAVLGAMALALPLPAIAAAGFGGIFPDLIDQRLSSLASTKRGRQRRFNKIHRGSSHWFGWWLLLFLAAISFPLPGWEIAAGFSLGALSHVGLDMLTPHGAPVLPFFSKFRIAVPICSTGRAGEYIFLALMLGAALWWFTDLRCWI